MPKDEFDFDDPMELNGVGVACEEDTTEAMTECFIEEFMRLGYNAKQILAMFRNPHYLGMNMALEKRGEPFVRDTIAEIFARWGRPVAWATACSGRREEAQTSADAAEENQSLLTPAATVELDTTATDPMGIPVPKLNL
jgi:hypothetical protein